MVGEQRNRSNLKKIYHWIVTAYLYDLVVTLNADELCSGITKGRVLNLEIYTHGSKKLSLLHLFTFHKEVFLTLQNKT